MTGQHAHHGSGGGGEHPAWRLLDAVVYLSAGLMVGVLVAVILGRGRIPVIEVPDSPASLVDQRPGT